jgi:hypothetical protein
VAAAIRALGYPVKSLHTQGGGVEDLLVAVTTDLMGSEQKLWLMVEVKVPNKSGTVKPSKFTPAQREWHAATEGFPRLIVTSAQDAVNQIRRMAE